VPLENVAGHPALEEPWRDGVHRDVAGAQLDRQRARQVMHRRLAGRVGERACPDALLHLQAVHRADVDDAGGVAVRRAALEQRRQVARQQEGRRHVEPEHLVERRRRVLGVRRAPSRTGVVDQNVQTWLACGDRLDERGPALLDRHVRRERVAWTMRAELGRGPVAGVLLARRDIDGGAGLDQPIRHHASDPARAAGDQGYLAGHREERRDVDTRHGVPILTESSWVARAGSDA